LPQVTSIASWQPSRPELNGGCIGATEGKKAARLWR